MNVLIIEDEAFAAQKLAKLIERYDPKIKVIDVLDTIEETVQWLVGNKGLDLIFLDIHLADGSSFEIFDQVKIDVPIIFTTAFDKYAVQAFKTNSIDYLLKPIRYEELKLAMDKFQKWFGVDKATRHIDVRDIMQAIQQGQNMYKTRFLVNAGNMIKTIPIASIAYFIFADRTTQIVTKEGRHYPIRQNLDQLESLLDPGQFYRANRQFIIHISAIAKISPWFKGRLKLLLEPEQSEDLVVSADKTKNFKAWLDQ